MTQMIRGSRLTDDWVFGKGKSDYLKDDDAIARDITTRLRIFKGECFFDGEIGVPWFSIIGQKDTGIILLELKKAILEVDGVTDVTDVRFTLSEDRSFVVEWWVNTINSTGVSGSATL
jgi:hypothetical protein